MIKFVDVTMDAHTNVGHMKKLSNKHSITTTAHTKLLQHESIDDVELLTFPPPGTTINILGKQLLKAAADGNLEDIRNLLENGAPFTADWLGTSPLHLAAQNNHLEICETLLRAGMSRDARTKVDRTPLHIASYEGHIDVVELLLKNGADYDCRDMLQMTPLHWATQNGHADVCTQLIRYGATTHLQNKFDLTPAAIALQIQRQDILQIINLAMRDPMPAVKHLTIEMNSDNSSSESCHLEPIMQLHCGDDEEGQEEESNGQIPIETIMLENDEEIMTENVMVNEGDVERGMFSQLNGGGEGGEMEENSFTESLKLLQQHGITMLPVDDNHILNSVMENGHSVVLTEAGKQALNSIKYEQDIVASSPSPPPQQPPTTTTTTTTTRIENKINNRRIITLSPEEFLAMTNSGQANIVKFVNNKISHQAAKQPPILKRVVMKKNKLVPAAAAVMGNAASSIKLITQQQHQQQQHTINKRDLDVNTLMEQLHKTQMLAQSYRKRLLKAECEAAKYKKQLRFMMNKYKMT